MLKKNKKITIRQRFREIIEIRQDKPVVMYCEICQCEQIFKVIDENDVNLVAKETEAKQLSESAEEK